MEKFDDINNLTGEVIGAAIEVHRILGPGLLENVYEQCLCRELKLRNFNVPLLKDGIKRMAN